MELTKENLSKYQGTFHQASDQLNSFYSGDNYIVVFENIHAINLKRVDDQTIVFIKNLKDFDDLMNTYYVLTNYKIKLYDDYYHIILEDIQIQREFLLEEYGISSDRDMMKLLNLSDQKQKSMIYDWIKLQSLYSKSSGYLEGLNER